MATYERERVMSAPAAGAYAGFLAGIPMALAAMLRALVTGMGFWFPMKQIAALFFGVNALIGDAGVIIVGICIHLAFATIMGAIFGLLASGLRSPGGAFIPALLYGIAVWALMTYLGLPILNEIMAERVAMIPAWWFYYHLIYGAFLSITPAFTHAAATRKTRAGEPKPA